MQQPLPFFYPEEEEMGRDHSLLDSVFLVAELLDVAVPLELQHVLDGPQERRDAFMNIRRLARENGARSPRSENRARKARWRRVSGANRQDSILKRACRPIDRRKATRL